MTPDSIPKLARGCRLTESGSDGWVLLIPEGVLRLSGPGPHILRLCDGSRTFAEVVRALGEEFGASGDPRIETETAAFLDRLCDRRIVVTQ